MKSSYVILFSVNGVCPGKTPCFILNHRYWTIIPTLDMTFRWCIWLVRSCHTFVVWDVTNPITLNAMDLLLEFYMSFNGATCSAQTHFGVKIVAVMSDTFFFAYYFSCLASWFISWIIYSKCQRKKICYANNCNADELHNADAQCLKS